jgi:hypothetical protein
MQRPQLGLSVFAARSTKHALRRNVSNFLRSSTSPGIQEEKLPPEALKLTSELIAHAAVGQQRGDRNNWDMSYLPKEKRHDELARIATKRNSFLADQRFADLESWRDLESDPKDLATSHYLTPPGTFVEIRRFLSQLLPRTMYLTLFTGVT